ncbi:GNAT family N-acetyltransferase [Novilysobacter spongiicola]|uniref:Ribosomal protein S18 acetylase RimI n=1 Tax=Lysobacter spongiicola DSM 21749 TaxID=1122188 RepID=A0A1T4Q6C2_9GAMM|nr:GNAT family N-acetyltransferase [Lysobacter spongiicola]SJZ99117.1 Ribosomal protein S18 acetylase RimI [Lysobacter spongiicola DSM 21749]
MPGRIRVRSAQSADADLLAGWAVAMAMETEHKALDPEVVLAGVRAGIANPGKARYFVAMEEALAAGRETLAEPVGMLMLTSEWSDWRNGDWWWIQSVYVAPSHRRRGVFAALYRYVEQLAREAPGVIGLRLYVERDNGTAQRTYGAMGMADAGYRIFEDEFPRQPG